MPRYLIALFALVFALTPARAESEAEADVEAVSLRIEVRAEYKGLTGEADFLTVNATQANHVAGGDRAFKVSNQQGEGLEFKRWGFIVNSLPVLDPNNPAKVDTQFQFELSGPVEGKDAVSVETWQLQSEILSTLGKWKTIANKPGKVSVRISVDKE